jgi:hypothetical protein
LATGLAACAHLLVLLLLGWKIPRFALPARRDDGPVVQVTLLRPEIPPPRETVSGKTKPEPPSAPSPPARVLTAPAPQAPLTAITPRPPPQGTPAPVPPTVETSPDADRLRSALSGLVGCTGALADHLSHEEREACARRLAAAKPAPTGPLYTAKEAAGFDPNPARESIFVRKPHNGCLPHIGNRPAPPGAGAVAASGLATTELGLGCAWPLW